MDTPTTTPDEELEFEAGQPELFDPHELGDLKDVRDAAEPQGNLDAPRAAGRMASPDDSGDDWPTETDRREAELTSDILNERATREGAEVSEELEND